MTDPHDRLTRGGFIPHDDTPPSLGDPTPIMGVPIIPDDESERIYRKLAAQLSMPQRVIGPGDDDYGRARPFAMSPVLGMPYLEAPPLTSITMGRAVNKSTTIADGTLPTPSAEQARAIEILCRADGVVKRLSGKAGTGKSTVIRHVMNRVPVTICATTAKAALNVGGITLDRLFIYNRDKDRCRNEDKLRESMEGCATIIVMDEASMAGSKIASYVHRVCQMYGKTLILVGDWAQTMPVKDEWITKSSILRGAVTVFLTESHRQTDRAFLDALDALSVGAKNHPAYHVFEACKVRREPEGDHYVRIYATNKLTDAYNRSRLAELPDTHPKVPIKASAEKHRGDWYPNEEDRLIDDARFLHNTSLRLGARLICTKNDYQRGFVNGDIGELVDIGFLRLPLASGNILSVLNSLPAAPDGRPTQDLQGKKIVCWLSQLPSTVELEEAYAPSMILLFKQDRTGQLLQIHGTSREIMDVDDTVLQCVRGFPVKLGWACTVHSVQGATCDNVYVDMSSMLNFPEGSRHGLAYVALSRCRTLEGLKIYGWNPAAIECDPEVWCLLAPPPPPPPSIS